MKFLKQTRYAFVALVLSTILFQACHEIEPTATLTPTSAYDYKVYHKWNEKFLEIDRYAPGYRPGPGPRALGYLGLAAYESVVAGMPSYNSMENRYPGLDLPNVEEGKEYYWPACVNESYAFLMKRFFFHMEASHPTLFTGIEALRVQEHDQYAAQTTPEILERSEKFGQAIAAAVYEWEKTDQIGHNAFLDPAPQSFNPPTGPGFWVGQSPGQKPMFPYWGSVRTFAINETDKLAKAPIPYSEDEGSLFYTQAIEVYNTVNNINSNGPNAYEQKWIGEFWSDDLLNVTFAPPPRLVAIADQVISRENMNLEQAAELFAKMGMALSDAGVSVWYSKYFYNVERPFSYINRVVSQKFPSAANWKSALNNPLTGQKGVTPAFPAYPSGHSGFGGAGAKILSAMFEYTDEHPGTYTFTDLCHKERTEFIGTPRTYTSFKQMGDEDAYSRIPLGVHFRMDCDEGLRLGELAAQRVLELPWKK